MYYDCFQETFPGNNHRAEARMSARQPTIHDQYQALSVDYQGDKKETSDTC